MVVFGKGAEAQGPRSKINLRLNQPYRRFITQTPRKTTMASKKKKTKKKSK
jgi:hypothetical protein